jgi:hypothetical protein
MEIDEARDNRKKVIAQGIKGIISSIKDIISRFHHSPKCYFGQNRTFPVILGGEEKNIEVNRLIQAAWAHLIDLTEDYR